MLDSIFPDEIQDISDKEYRITIPLDVKSNADDTIDAPTIILNVRYPEAYPDEAPFLDVTQPPNAPKHAHLDIQEDKARLLDALQPTIEETLGMAMVFSLVSTLKDAAELLISERQQAAQALRDVEAQKAEEEENRKKKKRGGRAEEKKLTGRQLWQQGLVGKVMEEEDEEGEDAIEGMRELKVDG